MLHHVLYTFSQSLKSFFMKNINLVKKPKRILQELGIDTDILGQSRINGIRYHIENNLRRGKGFTEMKGEVSTKKRSQSVTPETKIRRLEHELAYTKQELEFVKKIIAAGSVKLK